MLFNSFSFLIFFPVTVGLYYIIPYRYRALFLLLASSYFYMAFVPKYILILFFLIVVDYFLGRTIGKQTGRKRKIFLFISIAANIGTLFFFKYFNFFNENISRVADFVHWNYSPFFLSIILPLGLSFHIFQSLSYVIEVYRGKYEPEKNFLIYALYVMFFPQLVAGPIERPYNLLPQFHVKHDFDFASVAAGLQRMLWGFFKKIVIADNLALYVDAAYNYPHIYPGLTLFVATFFLAFQIYCDFSGYSDIAIGSARVLGFTLMENFNLPYFSRSIAEFWRRWHISLSSWVRDYFYYPFVLSVKRTSGFRVYWGLFIAFVLIGLWHGARWTFVAFGALHGFYTVFGYLTKKIRQHIAGILGISKRPFLHRFLQIAVTFGFVCLSFIFFRADTIRTAYYILGSSLWGVVGLGNGVASSVYQLSFHPAVEALKPLFQPLDMDYRRIQFVGLFVAIITLVAVEAVEYRGNLFAKINSQHVWVRWLIYVALTLSIMNLGVTKEIPFIYFQF